jgi:hypothetical protein
MKYLDSDSPTTPSTSPHFTITALANKLLFLDLPSNGSLNQQRKPCHESNTNNYDGKTTPMMDAYEPYSTYEKTGLTCTIH